MLNRSDIPDNLGIAGPDRGAGRDHHQLAAHLADLRTGLGADRDRRDLDPVVKKRGSRRKDRAVIVGEKVVGLHGDDDLSGSLPVDQHGAEHALSGLDVVITQHGCTPPVDSRICNTSRRKCA